MLHPKRKFILYRWLLGLALLFFAVAMLHYLMPISFPPKLQNTEQYPLKELDIPSGEQKKRLKRAFNILSSQQPESKSLTYRQTVIDTGLFYNPGSNKTVAKGLPTLELSLVFLGKRQNYAVLNNKIYRQGEKLPHGRKIVAIKSRGVILKSGESIQLTPWRPLKGVALEKAPTEKDRSAASQEKQPIQMESNKNSSQSQNCVKKIKQIFENEDVKLRQNAQKK